MEYHIQRLLNRLSLLLSLFATISLLHIYFTTTTTTITSKSFYCGYHTSSSSGPHPTSSCALLSRDLLPPIKRFHKLASSKSFTKKVKNYSQIFQILTSLNILQNSSQVLIVAAGAAHEVVALNECGVNEITAVDLVEFPPYVKRSDPHNLPFFDGVFDLGFSSGLDYALFPRQFVREMERTVRKGGAEAVLIERVENDEELEEIKRLFRISNLVEVRNVSLDGSDMSLIVMKNVGRH